MQTQNKINNVLVVSLTILFSPMFFSSSVLIKQSVMDRNLHAGWLILATKDFIKKVGETPRTEKFSLQPTGDTGGNE